MSVVDLTPAAELRTQERGVQTRQRLIESALHEFSAAGFDAASTRSIATRAGVRQGQLTYHFESKDVLWRAVVDHLFARFDREFAAAFDDGPETDAAALFGRSIRALVRTVARLPELNRIMVHEGTADSERLDWIVDEHVRKRFVQITQLWADVRASGATSLDVDPMILYYTVVGAASLLYVNAAEARRLVGTQRSKHVVSATLIEAHADTLVAMLLGPTYTSTSTHTTKHTTKKRKLH